GTGRRTPRRAGPGPRRRPGCSRASAPSAAGDAARRSHPAPGSRPSPGGADRPAPSARSGRPPPAAGRWGWRGCRRRWSCRVLSTVPGRSRRYRPGAVAKLIADAPYPHRVTSEAPVAVVTGASRGAGRGIARALLSRGWRVYGTGRTVTDADGVIPAPLDHADDSAVAALFDRVAAECGRLDLLVNNAAAVHPALTDPRPFWQKSVELADILDIGLRSAYVAAYHAAPLLLAADRALIAFTSSPGSVCYMHGPAYGAQKA